MDKVNITALREQLEEGVKQLNLSLHTHQYDQLILYVSCLIKWNRIYNLTAIDDPDKIITHHLLDSLAIAFAFYDANHILDVGSGAGLPGLVLAICFPHVCVTLIDKVHKKTAFLTQVKTELCLKNVSVYTARVEAFQSEQLFDIVTSRAFSDIAHFIYLTEHLVKTSGKICALKGQLPQKEIDNIPCSWQVKKITPIAVPFLNVKRHMIELSRANCVDRDI